MRWRALQRQRAVRTGALLPLSQLPATTGTAASPNARVGTSAFAIEQGEERLRSWEPQGGQAKWYCADCGGHLFSRPDGGAHVYVRMGALDADPGIAPEYRQWVSSAASWEQIPDDGLPRFDEAGP